MASPKENGQLATCVEDENNIYLLSMQLAMGTVLPMALQTATQLGIFDIIAKAGPAAKLSASDIAAQLSTKNQRTPIMVDRLARLLASHSVLNCSLSPHFERLYSLSPLSYYFARNQDGVCLGPFMDFFHDKIFMGSWPELKDAVLEGGIAFDRARGLSSFEYTGLDDRFNQLFNSAMLNLTSIVIKKVVECYKGFEGIKHLVDVGGGQGIALHAITSKYPHIKGINFDLPHVVQHAPSYPGVQHVGGDMFESIPHGDAIFVKGILHDWGDEQCLKLLKNCYKSIPENGKMIVLDSTIPIKAETSPLAKTAFTFDIVMMTQHHGGKERTKEDMVALANKAGFNRIYFDCVACHYWVIEFYKN